MENNYSYSTAEKINEVCDILSLAINEVYKQEDKKLILKCNKLKEKYDKLFNDYEIADEKFSKNLIPNIKIIQKLKEEVDDLYREIVETTLSAIQQEPLNVNRFVCKKCGWSVSATLFGAPHKCGGCGSKDYLERAVIITKRGKVKNPEYIKFNPDTNKYKDKIGISTESAIKEKIDKLSAEIEKKMKQSTKTKKEDKKMSEKVKTYKVQCMNDKCGFAYETQKPNLNKNINACQVCGNMNLKISEKAPEKKISRYDRD